jgi:hypothetical protein
VEIEIYSKNPMKMPNFYDFPIIAQVLQKIRHKTLPNSMVLWHKKCKYYEIIASELATNDFIAHK